MKAVLIPGDGIGREIAESVREVSAALNTGIEWQEFAAGAEYAAGVKFTQEILDYVVAAEIANGVKLITRPACEKICRFAFDYARKNGRKKVTAVHKANIMKLTDGLFLRTFREVAAEYPEITADDCIIDALCMKLVQKPEQFDVLVAPNLYGDIISDLCAGLVGGLGFAPSANIGDSTRIYEAVHGSAPDIAGQDKANPSAILMAFAMMLNDLGETDKAAKLNAAILAQVEEGKVVTADIGGTAGTKGFTQAIISRLAE